LAVAIVVSAGLFSRGGRRGTPRKPVVFNEKTPLPALTEALREGDARALAALYQRMTARNDALPKALSEVEAAEWIEVLKGLRTGFLKFGGYGRTSVMPVTTKIFDRFAVEPAPANWLNATAPVRDLFVSGLNDPDLNVRVAAMMEVCRIWGWVPGRSMLPVEIDYLADWKEGMVVPVKQRLSDRESKSRVAAVACLGTMPLDKVAAPAIPYLEDPSGEVRQQVLISFASRPGLLSTDAIIKRLYDADPGIPSLAETVLKTRGLKEEHIGFARLLYHPKPELRASLIPLIRNRTDIDPVVWLLRLSEDREESVRIAAIEALADRTDPEVLNRFATLATSDPSPGVREAAARHVSPTTQTASATPLPLPRPRGQRERSAARAASPTPENTVALPPLPGSASLNPKAN
jgi:HEAT repeat protein